MKWVLSLLLLSIAAHAQAQPLSAERLTYPEGVWIDPAFDQDVFFGLNRAEIVERATVWFDEQLLGDSTAFRRRTEALSERKRRALRSDVLQSLMDFNDRSFDAAQAALTQLEAEGKIGSIERHWIVNGFTCEIDEGGLEALQTVPGVKYIYRPLPIPRQPQLAPEQGPRFISEATQGTAFDPEQNVPTWNLEMLGAAQTWRDLGVTGKGTLHVVHDFGFKLNVPTLIGGLYRNPLELPDNQIDDDGNGLVDDYHGFDFDAGTPGVNTPSISNIGFIHGNVVAGLIAGRRVVGGQEVFGVAPDAQWLPLTGLVHLEAMVEWALLHEADTYTMSFSIPSLNELRAHWRKVMEHGALAGLYFISGAGNFADPNRPTFAPVPVQMRTPEDIPGAVFGVAGVDRQQQRPVFSSQGPVVWNTTHYDEGTVLKPDLSTYNDGLAFIDTTGQLNTTNLVRGNSFSGPHLAGVVGLMLEADPDLLPWAARSILNETAKDLLTPGPDAQTGYGVVQAHAAVAAVLARNTTAEYDRSAPPTLRLGSAHPNPFHAATTLAFTLSEPGEVSLVVYDTLGREVATLIDGHYPSGQHQVTFQSEDRAPGVYHFRLRQHGAEVSQPVLLLR